MKSHVDRLARRLSDPDVLRLSRRSVYGLAGCLCVWVFYVGLCLNQSSIGIWNNVFGPSAERPLVHLGSPKTVRSDEWNTLTPWILNQYANHFPGHNENIGAQRSAVLTGTPVNGWMMLAQPKFWGFYVLPEAYGFSWSWAWKTFATLGALFLMLLALTGSNGRWALLGTLWIYGSSFTQWWFSNGLPEMICASALALVGALYLLRSQRRSGMAFGALLVAFAVCNLLTYLYPAFQYPLLWLAIAAVVGKTIEHGSWNLAWQHKPTRLTALGLCIVAIGLFTYEFARQTMPTIRLVLDTVYPGRRVSLGGDVPFYRLFDGFFEGFRTSPTKHPLSPNPSEASNYVLLFPFAVLLVPLRELFRRDQALVLCLTVYCLFVCAWIALPLPAAVRSALAATGWSLSPPIRSVLGVGVGSIVLTVVIGARMAAGTLPVRRHAWVVAAVAALGLIAYGRALHRLDHTAFADASVLAGTVASVLVICGLYRRKFGLAVWGVGMFIVLPLCANPLVSGLAPLLDKPILRDAKAVSGPKDRWMVVGSFVFSQGLKAQGLSVVTGSEYYPDARTIAALDPEHRHANIWNRYAHIVVASVPAALTPRLKLNQADLYTASLAVCGPAPRAWGVTLVAYTAAVPQADRRCLQEIPTPDSRASGVTLFRMLPAH